MDEEYIYESTETESIDKSIDSVESVIDDDIGFELNDEDHIETINMIYQSCDDYIQENILQLASPVFYKTMLDSITESTFISFLSMDLCEDDEGDYELVGEFVEQVMESYMEASTVPKRSISFTAMANQKTEQEFISLKQQIEYLQSIELPKQKSKEWYEMRYNLITASNLYKVFGSEAVLNSLIYEKCKPLDVNGVDYRHMNTESAIHWGNKYEPVTVMVYEDMFETKIGDFGCIPHPDYPFIGASPDGINIDPDCSRYGRMLEIKNIVNRDITGIPKEEYWVQTQMQMEVCNLDECDFVETRFKEYADENDFHADTTREYKGVILHFIEKPNGLGMANKNSMPVYRYMPIRNSCVSVNEWNTDSIEEWIIEQKSIERVNNLVLFGTIYWYLEEFSCVYIPRNRFWFDAALPKIKGVWDIILKERVDGYEHRSSKKRGGKPQFVGQDASNSYVIKNMPLTNAICLVKLDT
jgi:putative phage-type endonuclease